MQERSNSMKNRVFLSADRRIRDSLHLAAARAVLLTVLAAVFFCIRCSSVCAAGCAQEEVRHPGGLYSEGPEEEVCCPEDLYTEDTETEEKKTGVLVLEDPGEKTRYAGYEMSEGDVFSVRFIHSVNKSPVTDYFEIREDGIYGVKTVYYGFGAGVAAELEEGQTLTYGEDGSMIITGFDVKLNDLIYRVGTVSDHILTLQDGKEISLRDLCGRSARVCFRFEPGSP